MPTSQTASLARALTLVAAISIIIGNVIGTGVFLKARVMTCNVGAPALVIAVWVAAGLLSLAGALGYAELAAMMPQAGGEYVFLKRAYGRIVSFLYGWTQLLIAKTGSQASIAMAFAIFLNDLSGGGMPTELLTVRLAGYDLVLSSLQTTALGAILCVTLVNCAAVAVSGGIATVLTGVKIALVLGIGTGAFLFAAGDWHHLGTANVGGACEGVSGATQLGWSGFGAAMIGALWAYDGWNNLTLVAGEVKDPERNIPRALVGGTMAIVLLYVFVNLAYFYVLDATTIASVSPASSVARETASRFLGAAAGGFIAAGLMASSFGTLHTSMLAGARIPYAMARDGVFFERLGRVSPRTRAPIAAVILQGAWASVLALSGSFDSLTDYVLFGSWIFYALGTGSLFVLRRRLPDAERPYRAWGYPWVPALFLVVTALLLANTLATRPHQSLGGLGLMALGLVAYFFFLRERAAQA